MFLVSVADFMFRLGKIKATNEFIGVSYKIVGSNDGTNNSAITCCSTPDNYVREAKSMHHLSPRCQL